MHILQQEHTHQQCIGYVSFCIQSSVTLIITLREGESNCLGESVHRCRRSCGCSLEI